MTTWSTAQHELVQSEVSQAYLDGISMGLRLAREAYSRAIVEMLAGPYAYCVERYPMSQSGKSAIKRMLDSVDRQAYGNGVRR